LENGADRDIKDYDGKSALEWAESYGSEKVTSLLKSAYKH